MAALDCADGARGWRRPDRAGRDEGDVRVRPVTHGVGPLRLRFLRATST
jgi:hypothetical protein